MSTYCLRCFVIRGRGHGCASSQSVTWSISRRKRAAAATTTTTAATTTTTAAAATTTAAAAATQQQMETNYNYNNNHKYYSFNPFNRSQIRNMEYETDGGSKDDIDVD